MRDFKEGLRDLGWIDGRTIQILERYDNDDPTLRREQAVELVALQVDVFYVTANIVHAVRKATRTIPIVCADFYDPVAEGATTSMARPDGNVTGVSWQSFDSAGKRLQLALELLPHARRIGWLFDGSDLGAHIESRGVTAAARVAGVRIEKFELRTPRDLEPALAKLKGARLDVLLVATNPLTWSAVDRIVQAATANRLPVISEAADFAKAGAIVTYGADPLHAYRRGAYFVDRILRGAVPADLPIEQPTRFQLTVNLKAAKALGLAVPVAVMERATDVIR